MPEVIFAGGRGVSSDNGEQDDRDGKRRLGHVRVAQAMALKGHEGCRKARPENRLHRIVEQKDCHMPRQYSAVLPAAELHLTGFSLSTGFGSTGLCRATCLQDEKDLYQPRA